MRTIGRYELREKLGEGGMGVVYRAHDPLLDRTIAVKLISASMEGNAELRERFFREARAAGQLSHRNIITIHDLGEFEGRPYLAMEYLEGEDLQRRLSRGSPMNLSRKFDIAIGICEGLQFAHGRGIVHRDIKPANVFITDSGTVKILDFGLARMVTSEMTQSHMLMGTLNYMSPEQVRGERADHRSDIFSTGVMLYELLGGRKAFEADSVAATLYKILEVIPEPLQKLDSSIPPEIVAIVDRALAKSRDERYQNLGEMIRDLLQTRPIVDAREASDPSTAPTRFLGSLPDPAPPSGSSARGRTVASNGAEASPNADTVLLTAAPATAASAAASHEGSAPAPPVAGSRSRGSLFAAAAAGVLVIAAAAWFTSRPTPRSGPPMVNSQPTEPQIATPPQNDAASATATPPQNNAASATAVELAAAAKSLESGDYDGARRAADQLLARSPDNDEALRIKKRAQEMMESAAAKTRGRSAADARTRMTQAKAAATAANAPTLAAAVYRAALTAETDANRLASAGQTGEAALKYNEASGLYRSAELGARNLEAEASRSSAAAPPLERSQPTAPEAAASSAERSKPAASDPVPSSSSPSANNVPPPPSPPPSAPREPAFSAEKAARDLLGRYEAALESRELAALKQIWPSLAGNQQDAINTEFQNSRRIQVEVREPDIAISGDAATVTFTRRYEVLTVEGDRLRTDNRTVMTLRRSGNEWVIQDIRIEPRR